MYPKRPSRSVHVGLEEGRFWLTLLGLVLCQDSNDEFDPSEPRP